MNQQLIEFLKNALECSVLIAPLSPGLSFQELGEIGRRAGYQDGEINDALRHVGVGRAGTRLLIPSPQETSFWRFYFHEDPDYRNFDAFDFVVTELNGLVRSEGIAKAAIERRVLVERAIAAGLARDDVQVAITWQVMAGQLLDADGIIKFANSTGVQQLPSVQLGFHPQRQRRPHRERAYGLVKDIIARRTDGRPKHVEPLSAFADELDKLGYAPFRLWWTHTCAELRVLDPGLAPVAASVLAAALVEGALTFVMRHARKNGQFLSPDYERDPQTWKIEKLVASAASGGPSAILDLSTKAQAEILIRNRQRIHAGRMLSDYPGGPLDVRPDEARAAKATAELVVRAVLDWLQRIP
ncbi:hypothetical protein H8B02_16810 [Bradyrhizobium sp. Pear77]|uniref:hypothetical protein n=1 Tax=Bradyrhizobium altum TaxID=1571202 RepID=UPI001E390D32|nr:hypothetical protein [Bradyrhizobium altum]MCC8955040.1 hypothetical protein [Bradyrhizobium altum]